MIIEVKMPVLGLTMEEGTIIEWTKAEGEKVQQDETLLVVETDKAASDVPSPGSGILARIVAQPGETIPVGQVIAYLAETEADLAKVPAGPAAATAAAAPTAAAAAAATTPAAPRAMQAAPAPATAGAASRPTGTVAGPTVTAAPAGASSAQAAAGPVPPGVIEVKMPVLGLTMEEGTIIEWTKAEGEKVQQDETLLVVETDKAASDVPSPGSGILARIVAQPGETIPVGQVIAYLAETEADLAKVPAGPAAATAAAAPTAAAAAEAPATPSFPSPVSTAAPAPVPSPTLSAQGQRVFASPRARAKARALGIDLATVPYSGERIIEQDVLRAAAAGLQPGKGARLTPLAARLAAELGIDLAALAASPEARIRAADLLLAAYLAPETAAAPAAGAQPAVVGAPAGAAVVAPGAPAPGEAVGPAALPPVKPLNRVRRITAERMTFSWQTAPQVTFNMRCDMTKAVELRQELKPEAEARGIRLTFDAMFVRAVATALMEFPEVNSQWVEGEGIRTFPAAHVGVAVDLGENGLIVPVIRNADSRGLFSTAAELDRLVKLAREGKLGPDDYKGGTFTITNLGLLGVESFAPVINPPEAAILAIGAIAPTPVFREGQLVERQVAILSLTTDHRVLDGAPSARFLARIRSIMEQPLLLLEKGL